MTAIEKLTKARSLLILDHPFFGSLALRLNMIENKKLETAQVDSTSLCYNPNWINKLSTQELVGTLAHEVMHIALGHLWRRGERNVLGWNIAGDFAINENLLNTGFTLPEGALHNPKYANLSSEEIYAQLQQEQSEDDDDNIEKAMSSIWTHLAELVSKVDDKQDSKDGSNNDENKDPGGCGSVASEKENQETKEMKSEWKAAVSQALQIEQGELPTALKRQMQETINPEVPWFILLRDFVERTARNDYDWTRPSKRFIGRGIILPSLISEQLPNVTIAIDTSGSIDNKALLRFATEASNVLGCYDTTIKIVYCDSKIQGEEVYTRADLPLKLEPVGGGGTNFCPVFEYLKNQEPTCLIYFTDLHGRFPKQEPEYPTMWLTTTKDKKAPFGITVAFN